MAVTKTLTKAVPYNKDSKVQQWFFEMKYEEGDKTLDEETGEYTYAANYYTSSMRTSIPATDDDGTVKIAAVDQVGADEAKRRIEQITTDVEVGNIYEGKVVKLMDFGAFVNILPGRDGLVHISQISQERVERVSDELTEGEMVRVKVLEVDRQGRIRLSIKAIQEDDE